MTPRSLHRIRDFLTNHWHYVLVLAAFATTFVSLWLTRNYVTREEFESYISDEGPTIASDAADIVGERLKIEIVSLKDSMSQIRRQIEINNQTANQNYMMILLHLNNGNGVGPMLPPAPTLPSDRTEP